MASPAQLAALQHWLKDHGGHLHPNAALEYSQEAGVHCKATTDLATNVEICTVPHSLALSSLNALVDDDFPVFRNRGLAVEAIGYFYLMRQYVQGDKSFWKPYIDTLPGPNAEHRTPFHFSDDDSLWLEDTDVLHTTKARMETHKSHYAQGIALLKAAKVDTEPYTWDLFLWAVTIFTSRSFSSRSLRPHDSKYWAAYKYGPEGRKQTVLLDMSNASAEELDFPVLFPVIDILNHAPNAKVHWAYDPGKFSLTILDGAKAGAEMFNNYGAKRNDELLLGYGFCIPENPHDKALLTLKPPPESLQTDVRRVQPGYFDSDGTWSSEKATFGLPYITSGETNPGGIFHELPEPLLELLIYILRSERGLPFSFMENPLEYLTTANSIGHQYLPQIARMIVQSLLPKLAKLQSSTPQYPPKNKKQEQARIYRTGQLQILESITGCLRNYLRFLVYPPQQNHPVLLTLEGLLQTLQIRAGPTHATDFLNGIGSCAGTTDIAQLREAGWEDDAFVLLLCWTSTLCPTERPRPEYLAHTETHDEESLEQARSAFDLVQAAAAAPGVSERSFWKDTRWSEAFIADVGGRLLKYESFAMMVPSEGEEDRGDVKLVYYFHG